MAKIHEKTLLKKSRVAKRIVTDPAKMITAAEAEKVRHIIIIIDDFYELLKPKRFVI